MKKMLMVVVALGALQAVACTHSVGPPEQADDTQSSACVAELPASLEADLNAAIGDSDGDGTTSDVGFASDGDIKFLTDPPYSPTCSLANGIDRMLDRIKGRHPKGELILLEPPKVTVTGTVPNRVVGTTIHFVLVKELPTDDGKGGIAANVDIVVTNFEGWATSSGFSETQIKDIRASLSKDGFAVSGSFKFEESKKAEATSGLEVIRITIIKGTPKSVVDKHIADWKKAGKSGPTTIEKK